MGKDDRDEDAAARRRRREQEDEEALAPEHRAGTDGDGARLDALIARVATEIDRVHALYLQFASGYERLPPTEARRVLESLVAKLAGESKPAPAYQFRANTVQSRFSTYRDRWEKILLDLESGKLKRPAGPRGFKPKRS